MLLKPHSRLLSIDEPLGESAKSIANYEIEADPIKDTGWIEDECSGAVRAN